MGASSSSSRAREKAAGPCEANRRKREEEKKPPQKDLDECERLHWKLSALNWGSEYVEAARAAGREVAQAGRNAAQAVGLVAPAPGGPAARYAAGAVRNQAVNGAQEVRGALNDYKAALIKRWDELDCYINGIYTSYGKREGRCECDFCENEIIRNA